jgi:mannose-6-phosphate isomerase-like protein (cupin superfamily)
MNHLKQPRRKFLQTGAIGFFATFFTNLPKFSFARSLPGNEKGIVVHENEGEHLLTGRRKAPITIKISKITNNIDNMSFCTEDIIPGDRIRVHKHLNEDEFVFIHKGEGMFTLDEERLEVKAGSIVFVPKGVWHGLENTGKETIFMLFGYSPSGFEGYFRENGTLVGLPPKEKTAEEYAITEKKYGIVFK